MAVTTKPRSVIIVGGSLAGLMHALTFLSLPSPPKVRILERSPTALLHNQGAGIVCGNETQEFFNEYVKAGREIAITSRLRQYLQHNGEVVSGSIENKQQKMTSWDLLYNLLRWRVDGLRTEYTHDVTGDARPKAIYDHGCSIKNIEQLDDSVRLYWDTKDGARETATADLVIAADGASSTIRSILAPNVKREYAGYVAWRGTVPEVELSANSKETFVEKFTFYHSQGIQILGYLIPGDHGTTEAGKRLLNWVWYCNYEDGSSELEELMTDKSGNRHAITLPVGGMQDHVWERQKKYATEVLPPQYAEAISKTKQPFIQAITDVISPENIFFGGRVVLVGDSLAGFRPHTAASTSQAAFDAIQLGKFMREEISEREYAESVLHFAKHVQKMGVDLGQRSQFGHHPLSGA